MPFKERPVTTERHVTNFTLFFFEFGSKFLESSIAAGENDPAIEGLAMPSICTIFGDRSLVESLLHHLAIGRLAQAKHLSLSNSGGTMWKTLENQQVKPFLVPAPQISLALHMPPTFVLLLISPASQSLGLTVLHSTAKKQQNSRWAAAATSGGCV